MCLTTTPCRHAGGRAISRPCETSSFASPPRGGFALTAIVAAGFGPLRRRVEAFGGVWTLRRGPPAVRAQRCGFGALHVRRLAWTGVTRFRRGVPPVRRRGGNRAGF